MIFDGDDDNMTHGDDMGSSTPASTPAGDEPAHEHAEGEEHHDDEMPAA